MNEGRHTHFAFFISFVFNPVICRDAIYLYAFHATAFATEKCPIKRHTDAHIETFPAWKLYLCMIRRQPIFFFLGNNFDIEFGSFSVHLYGK